jgi:hypothetical protein
MSTLTRSALLLTASVVVALLAGGLACADNAETVRDFGAIGDGVADDTDAIQRMIDKPVGSIRLPRGRYRIARPIVIELDRVGSTSPVQRALVAKRYSPYLSQFYEPIKSRRGSDKAIIALAKKFLGISYNTLKDGCVFADFLNFELTL